MTQQKPHRITYACALLISLLFAVFAKSVRAESGSTVLPQSQMLTQFRFEMLSGGIVILHAKLGNFPDTLNFILDTGSGGISLDSLTVEYFKLPITPSNRTIRGIAGVKNISFVMNQTLHLPGLQVNNLDFHINDYEILSSVYGMKIDGIIGYSFLSRYIIKLDYDTHTMEVWTIGKVRYPKVGLLMRPKINGLAVVGASVKDYGIADTRFIFDTGAGLCLLITEQLNKDSAIIGKRKKIIPTQGEGLGGKKPMQITTVKQVKIGQYKFRQVPEHIFDDEYKLTSYPEMGGLVGNDLLRRFNLVINYSEKEIHLSPNTHFYEPFDYSYTGLGIYMVDGEVVVEDVIKDSPGEEAGLQPGDRILGIDNNFSGSIQSYKSMLQIPNSRLKLMIMRDGKPRVVLLHVKSIL